MTLREFSALLSTIFVTVGTTWYVFLALRGIKVKPVLASWIVIAGTMTLSFATYLTTPKASWISNACNGISVLSTCAILFVSVYLTFKKQEKLVFSRFQKVSLQISGVIMVFWIVLVWGFHGTGIIPNIITQVLMLIGYAVTAEKLWYAKGNNESMFTWWCILIACIIALYTGAVSHDSLAVLYAARATFGTSVLVWLMYRADRKAVSAA